MSKILFWDIETTGLEWKQHRFLNVSMRYTPYISNIVALKLGDEHAALVDLRDMLDSYDSPNAGWSSRRFDIPFVNYRLSLYDEAPLRAGNHIDVQQLYTKNNSVLLDRSSGAYVSLEKAAKSIGAVDENVKKGEFIPEIWAAADAGDAEAHLWIINNRGKSDVLLTERVYDWLTRKEYEWETQQTVPSAETEALGTDAASVAE